MEVRLTLCTVVVTVMFGGCLSEYCTTGTGQYDIIYCSSGCCGSYPYQYCCLPPSSPSSRVDPLSTRPSTVLDSWVIGLIILGLILVVSTFIAIFCCVRRSRGARGVLVNRQGMTTMTTASTVYTTNGHQQPSTWQYPQHSAPYHQQPAAGSQQPVTSNFQHQYYPTGQTHAHTAGYAPLPSYTVNDAILMSSPPPAYDDIINGEPLKY